MAAQVTLTLDVAHMPEVLALLDELQALAEHRPDLARVLDRFYTRLLERNEEPD